MKIKLTLIAILCLGLVTAAWKIFFFPDGEVKEIVLTESGFSPQEIIISRGDSIKFSTNRGQPFWPASNLHPLHDLYPQFDPKAPIAPNASWAFKLTKVGSWEFHDHLFPYFKGVIKVVTGPVTQTDNHLAAHVYGEGLYQKEGLSGIVNCDDSVGFGCFHGFFLRAVGERGVEAAFDLDKKCLERFGPLGLGCPHGIGHGLGEYFGPEKLTDQLNVCRQLTWQGELFGCAGGVFMEYNFPRQQARLLAGEDYYQPCDRVADQFANACYFELPAWWLNGLDASNERMGQLCQGVKELSSQADCFIGLGNSLAESSQYDLPSIQSTCALMPSVNSQTLCLAGASWALFANPDHRVQAQAVCQTVNINEELCLEKAKLL